ARQHELVVDLATGLLDEVDDLGGRHDGGLDPRTVGPATHEGEVGALPAQQAERRDDHRLARAGLAGDDGEPRAQLELGLLDDTERLEPQVVPHQRPPANRRASAEPRHPATGSSNLRTSRSANDAGWTRASRT